MGTAGKRMPLLGICRTSLAIAVLFCVAAQVNAAATILSTDFGAPFVPGNIVDQFGWKSAGNGTSSATITASGGLTGAGLEVERDASSDRRWAVPNQVGFPSQRFVAIDWDMKVNQAPVSSGFGPFFGVDTYDDTPAPSVLGALGVDASTGDVLYQLEDTGTLQETGIQIAFGQWTHFRIVLDFATDTYYGLVNGTVRATTGFVDDIPGNELDNFTDADIAAFAAAADGVSQGLTSTAVFDNFLVRDGLAGDYDIDGDVDSADYTRWRATFGATVGVPGNAADGNSNGVVDAADYVVWRNNLGASLFSGTGAGASIGLGSAITAVPEPASLMLGLLSLPVIAFLPRRHRRAPVR